MCRSSTTGTQLHHFMLRVSVKRAGHAVLISSRLTASRACTQKYHLMGLTSNGEDVAYGAAMCEASCLSSSAGGDWTLTEGQGHAPVVLKVSMPDSVREAVAGFASQHLHNMCSTLCNCNCSVLLGHLIIWGSASRRLSQPDGIFQAETLVST